MSTVEDTPLANSAIKARTLKSFIKVNSLTLCIAYTRYEYLNSTLYLGWAQEFQRDNYKVGLVNIETHIHTYICVYTYIHMYIHTYIYIYGQKDL